MLSSGTPTAPAPPTATMSPRPSRIVRDLAGLTAVAVAGIAGFYLFPNDLGLLTRMVSAAFLVVSLDLLVGYAGVATLGQAAMFGLGAYAAANTNLAGVQEPLVMVLIGGLAGALGGLVSGAIVLRAHGLPRLVLTIAVVQLAHEAANKLSAWTGGSDGLSGLEPGPVLGLFRFDLYGRTGFLFSLVLLVITLAVLVRLTRSPFGLKVRAIGRDPGRVRTMGGAVLPTLLVVYTIAGLVAGMGGALEAIAAGVVGLDAISFERSATALVMLVLGGAGSLFGAVLGTVVFMGFEHIVSASNPFHWLIVVGVMLVAVVLFLPRGLGSAAAELQRLARIAGLGGAR
ncbi:branched-chain amino acid ABC transporter permease [Methyloraptor flagellatus]|uniref:Branched-chain amino acid ABC transporter permease n=1 Tax=Methyloraptor flagellatus TaxID=3162530 RepID=A0AAU7XBQ1_9HYPH